MTPLGGKPRTTASFDLSSCSLFLFTAWLAIDAAIKLKRGVTDRRSSKSKSHGNDGSLVGDSGYTYKDPWSEARATFLPLAVPSFLRKTYSRQSHTSISSSLLLPEDISCFDLKYLCPLSSTIWGRHNNTSALSDLRLSSFMPMTISTHPLVSTIYWSARYAKFFLVCELEISMMTLRYREFLSELCIWISRSAVF